MPDGNRLSPSYAPWVLIGGSYAGMHHVHIHSNSIVDALVRRAYELDHGEVRILQYDGHLLTRNSRPNVFWAGYASSAVVEAILWVKVYYLGSI